MHCPGVDSSAPLGCSQGFCIGSAALVGLALFGAYVVRAKISVADSSILDPEVRGPRHWDLDGRWIEGFGIEQIVKLSLPRDLG